MLVEWPWASSWLLRRLTLGKPFTTQRQQFLIDNTFHPHTWKQISPSMGWRHVILSNVLKVFSGDEPAPGYSTNDFFYFALSSLCVPGENCCQTPSHFQLPRLQPSEFESGPGPLRWKIARSQLQYPGQLSYQDRPPAVRDSDHSAIRTGPQWWETASSQRQHPGPLSHQDRSPAVRDSEQSVATL